MSQDDRPWLIAIAASAGGIEALQTVVAGLPAATPAAVVIVQHRNPAMASLLEHILARRARMPVKPAKHGELVEPGAVYVSRLDLHLTIAPEGRFEYVDGAKVRGLHSSANPLLETAAAAFADRTIAVVLTGSGLDATDGVQSVKSRGGTVIVQDPSCAAYASMPASAIKTGMVDHILRLDAISPALVAMTQGQMIAPHP